MDAIDDVQRRVRAIRVAAHRDQTLVRHRRGDPVRVDHRAHRPATVAHLDREHLARSGRTRRRGRRRRRRTGVVRSDRPQSVGRHRRLRIPAPNSPTGGSARSGCTATTLRRGTGNGPRSPGRRSTPRCVAHGDGQPRRRLTGRCDVAADRGPGRLPGRRVVRHRQACRSGDRRRPQHYPQDIEATTAARLADRAAGIRRGILPTDDGAPRDRRRTRVGHPPR